jgi:hypothetical protein
MRTCVCARACVRACVFVGQGTKCRTQDNVNMPKSLYYLDSFHGILCVSKQIGD